MSTSEKLNGQVVYLVRQMVYTGYISNFNLAFEKSMNESSFTSVIQNTKLAQQQQEQNRNLNREKLSHELNKSVWANETS